MSVLFYAIEGHDYAGKTTVVQELKDNIHNAINLNVPSTNVSINVCYSKAPDADSYIGRRIYKLLGSDVLKQDMDSETRQAMNIAMVTMFANDRARLYSRMAEMDASDDIHVVICDRGMYSSLVMPNCCEPGHNLERYLGVLQRIESNIAHYRHPDTVFVIECEPHEIVERIAKRGTVQDAHESIEYITAARRRFMALYSKDLGTETKAVKYTTAQIMDKIASDVAALVNKEK